MPKVRLVQRKLGRERVLGRAEWDGDEGLIEIDPRLSPKQQLITLIHEAGHIIFDDDSETNAPKWERVASIVWKAGYRKVHQ